MKQLRDMVVFLNKDYWSKSQFRDLSESIAKITEFTKKTPNIEARFEEIEGKVRNQLEELVSSFQADAQAVRSFDSALCQKASKVSLEELEVRMRQEGSRRAQAVREEMQDLLKAEQTEKDALLEQCKSI